jgi:hypothetical protein
MRSTALFVVVWLSIGFVGCSRGPDSVPARSGTDPVSAPPPSSPPTPLPTDWKGLLDTDSESSNVPPAPALVADVLRHEPACSRVLTVATGGFTSTDRDETAYLLSCGATQRVLITNEKGTLASLDVPEDTLEDAGDLDLDGPHELLLHGHAGPGTNVRVLRFGGGQLSTFYTFTATPGPCEHIVIFYRLVKPNMEYRVDKPPKRCTP